MDTLVVGFGVCFAADDWQRIVLQLDEAKSAANLDPYCDEAYWAGGLVQQTGKGSKGGGPAYRWRIAYDSFTVLIQNRAEPKGETPNVFVEAGAHACLEAGSLRRLCERMGDLVTHWLGAEVTFSKVSRCDVFVDLADVEAGEFNRMVAEFRRVTRARAASEFEVGMYRDGRRQTGVSLGKGIVFRAYDKLHELKRDAAKRAHWEQAEWDGNPPDVCTRYEFELKREQCKSFGINTLDDLQEKIGGVSRYLCEHWLRFTAEVPDARNPQRAATAEVWKRLQAALASGWEASEVIGRKIEREGCSVEALARQAAGLHAKIAAMKGAACSTVEEFVGGVVDATMDSVASGFDAVGRVRQAADELATRVPLGLRPAGAYFSGSR